MEVGVILVIIIIKTTNNYLLNSAVMMLDHVYLEHLVGWNQNHPSQHFSGLTNMIR